MSVLVKGKLKMTSHLCIRTKKLIMVLKKFGNEDEFWHA